MTSILNNWFDKALSDDGTWINSWNFWDKEVWVSNATELISSIQGDINWWNYIINLSDGVYDLTWESEIILKWWDDLWRNSLIIQWKNGLNSNVVIKLWQAHFDIYWGVVLNNITIESVENTQFALYVQPRWWLWFTNLKIEWDTISSAFTGIFAISCEIYGEGLNISNFERGFVLVQWTRGIINKGDIWFELDNTALWNITWKWLVVDDQSVVRVNGNWNEIKWFDIWVSVESNAQLRIKNVNILDNNTGIFMKDKWFIFVWENNGVKPKLRNNETLNARWLCYVDIQNCEITSWPTSAFHFLRVQDRSVLKIRKSELIREAWVDGRWAIYARSESRLNWEDTNTIQLWTGTWSNDHIARIDLSSSVFAPNWNLVAFELLNNWAFYPEDWD